MARPERSGHDVMADLGPVDDTWFSFGWLAPSVALANAVVLVLVVRYLNPSTVAFLTDEIDRVAPFIRLALVVSLIGNIVRLWFSPLWFISLADVAATLAGLVATIRLYQVFPFDVGDGTDRWAVVIRVLLLAAMIGAALGIALSSSRLLASRRAVGRRHGTGS